MSSLEQRQILMNKIKLPFEIQILMNKTKLPVEILHNISQYDIDFKAKKVMDDLIGLMKKIHDEEENDYVAHYLLEGGAYEIEILDESIPRKNINKYLKIIEDYLKIENKNVVNNIIEGYFNININQLYDYDILNFYDSQHIIYDDCENTDFLNFLSELSYIYKQWSIDYCDDMFNNYSDIEDY